MTRLPLRNCSYAPGGGAMRSARVKPTARSSHISASKLGTMQIPVVLDSSSLVIGVSSINARLPIMSRW